jgi:hypothetical protein
MSDNIIIKITADSNLKSANDDLQSLQDRERDIQNEMRKSQADYQKQLQNIQATVKGREAQVAAIDKLNAAQTKQQRSLEDEQKKMKATLTDFTSKMGAVNDTIAKGAVQTPKFTTQMRAMKQELTRMQMEGVAPTDKAFMELSIRAGEMGNEIDDARSRVKVLASDTKYLDATMGLGNGLAGGFAVATSAAALLGGENEQLAKAFLQVQAVMSILNGVQAVAIALNKDEAFSVMLNNTLEKSSIVTKIKSTAASGMQAVATRLNAAAENGSKIAKVGSTVAQWALNSAMLANPVFWLIGGIGLLVGAYLLFSDSAKESKKRQEDFNLSLQSMKNITEQMSGDTDFYKQIAEAQGKSKQEVMKIARQGAKDEVDIAEKKYAELMKKYLAASKSEREKMKDGLKEAEGIQTNARKNLSKINQDATVLDQETIYEATKVVNQGKITLMKEGYEKEKAQIELDFNEKMKLYSGQSQEELNARAMLESERNKAILTLQKKYIAQAAEIKATDAKTAELNDRANYELKKKTIQEEANAQIASANASTDTESKKASNIKKIRAQLKIDLKAIDDQQANDKAENLVLQDKNVEMAMKLQHNKDLKLQDDLNKQTLEDQAKADILKVKQSVATAEQKADKIKAIELKLSTDVQAIDNAAKQREIDDTKFFADKKIADEKFANEKILADFKSTGDQKIAAQKRLNELETASIKFEKDFVQAQYDQNLIDKKVYQQKMFDIGQKKRDKELADIQKKAEIEKEVRQAIFDLGSTLVNGLFDAKKEALAQESSDLDQFYTTDIEAAKKNKDLKLITENEMAAKKLDIKRKEAALNKAQAIFNIALSTAEAVMAAAKTPPLIPWIIALGAVEAALVMAKPLPKYAKGRKGGRGEFATVGERGPETMWIPEGASIVPTHRRLDNRTFKEFGIPQLHIPELPNVDSRLIEQSIISNRMDIDYNRLGKAVADNVKIPKYEQKHVTVNVDKNGIIVKDGTQTTHYLNKKYSSKWN